MSDNTLQNWHGDNSSMQQNSIDFGALLKQLITPNSPDPSTAANSLGPATLTQLGNTGKTTADAIGPYQQGVAKALKDLGQKHVQDAVAIGADPIADIQNHEIMQSQGNTTALHPLIGALANIGLQKLASQNVDNLNQPINNDSNKSNPVVPQVNVNPNFMSGAKVNPDGTVTQEGTGNQILRMILGVGGPSTDVALARAIKMQRIAAGQPAEIGLPQSQMSLLQSQKKQTEQQIAGLTPAQQAEAIGGYNTSLINQHNELQKSITDQITSTATAIDQLVKNTPIGDKAFGSPYYDTLKQLQQRLQGLTNQGKSVVQSFKDLQLKNPSGGNNQSPGIQSFNVGGITYNIPANKVEAFKKAKGL